MDGHFSYFLSRADLFYRRQSKDNHIILSHFSLPHALPRYISVFSVGKSLSLMLPTLLAPGVGLVFYYIYSTAMVHFFLGTTVNTHAPFNYLSIFPPSHFPVA